MTFGNASSPGLVLTGGDLTSLNMTVSTSFMLGTCRLLRIIWTLTTPPQRARTRRYSPSQAARRSPLPTNDSAWPSLSAMNRTRDSSSPAANLTNLYLTVTGKFSVDSVSIQASNLEFTYAAALGNQPAVFTLGGTAVAKISGLGNFSVMFGNGATPGLVISGGDLSSLDTTVDGGFTVGAAQFTAAELQFIFTAGATSAGDVFSLAGTATALIQGLAT